MRRAWAIGLGVFFLLLGAGGGAWFYSLSRVSELKKQIKEIEADISVDGMEFSQGAEGRVLWKVKAKSGGYTQDSAVLELEEPEITYFRGETEEPIQVKATAGRLDQGQGTAFLWPDVRIKSGVVHVEASRMKYTKETEIITLDDGVVVTHPDMTLTAPQMELYVPENEITATGGVVAEFLLRGEKAELSREN